MIGSSALPCRLILRFVDMWESDLKLVEPEAREVLLRPLIPWLIGTRNSDDITGRRAALAANWLLHVHASTWLRVAGQNTKASLVAGLPEIADLLQCQSFAGRLTTLRRFEEAELRTDNELHSGIPAIYPHETGLSYYGAATRNLALLVHRAVNKAARLHADMAFRSAGADAAYYALSACDSKHWEAAREALDPAYWATYDAVVLFLSTSLRPRVHQVVVREIAARTEHIPKWKRHVMWSPYGKTLWELSLAESVTALAEVSANTFAKDALSDTKWTLQKAALTLFMKMIGER